MYPILSYQKSNPPKSPKTLTLLNISIHPSVPPLSTWAQHTSISTSQNPSLKSFPKNKSQCKVPRTFKPLLPTAGHLFLSCHDPNKHSRKKYIYISTYLHQHTSRRSWFRPPVDPDPDPDPDQQINKRFSITCKQVNKQKKTKTIPGRRKGPVYLFTHVSTCIPYLKIT